MRYIGRMKTRSTLFILSFLFISHTSFSQDVSVKQEAFVNKFIATVASNSEKKTLKFLDKAYKKEQLENLNGDKEQLVNELFGGQDLADTDTYLNIKISEITNIEVVQVIKLKESNQYTYIFKVHKGDQKIHSSLRLKIKGKKYGFVGSLG